MRFSVFMCPVVTYSHRENSYIRVMGTLKSFGGRNYINATHIRPCKDPHEPYFHTLEAMTVTLMFQRGPVRFSFLVLSSHSAHTTP